MRNYTAYIFLFLLVLLEACSSGKQALERGDYDTSVNQSISRLRSNASNKKAAETLSMAYPLGKRWHLDQVSTLKISENNYKWETISGHYSILNNQYDAINMCPGCMRVIPDAIRYTEEEKQANTKVAQVRYSLGNQELMKGVDGDRVAAQQAVKHYQVAKNYAPTYDGIDNKIKEAEFYATLKVIMAPVGLKNNQQKLSTEEFENNIRASLNNQLSSGYKKYYSPELASSEGVDSLYDHIIILNVNSFNKGPVDKLKKLVHAVKDSVIIDWVKDPNYVVTPPIEGENKNVTICHYTKDDPGNPKTITIDKSVLVEHVAHGDYVGGCEVAPTADSRPGKKPVYKEVKAIIYTTTKSISTNGQLEFQIIDRNTGEAIFNELIDVSYEWSNEWGYFTGNKMALTDEQLATTQNKDVIPPNNQQLFNLYTASIQDQVIEKLNSFYSAY